MERIYFSKFIFNLRKKKKEFCDSGFRFEQNEKERSRFYDNGFDKAMICNIIFAYSIKRKKGKEKKRKIFLT